MKKVEKFKKFTNMKDSALRDEVLKLEESIIKYRIDIANRKTAGVKNINVARKDIARIKTILQSRFLDEQYKDIVAAVSSKESGSDKSNNVEGTK